MRRGDAGPVRSSGALEVFILKTLTHLLIWVWPQLRDPWLSPHLPVIAGAGWPIHEDFGILEMGSLVCN